MKTDENRNEDEETSVDSKADDLDANNKHATTTSVTGPTRFSNYATHVGRRHDSDSESNYRGCRKTCSEEKPPIDPKNWFDVIVSCGFGATEYTLGPKFAYPKFRAKFGRNVFLVISMQQIFILLWMLLFLTRPSFPTFSKEHPGFLVLACVVYGLIYCAIRFCRCGGEGLCLFGNIIIFLFMSFLLAYVSANFTLIFAPWPLLIFAFAATLIFITLVICCVRAAVLGKLIYAFALCLGLINGTSMMVAAYYFQYGPQTYSNRVLLQYYLPICLCPPIASLWVVYEVKKLIGGRRTHLNDDQWIIAATVL